MARAGDRQSDANRRRLPLSPDRPHSGRAPTRSAGMLTRRFVRRQEQGPTSRPCWTMVPDGLPAIDMEMRPSIVVPR